MDSTPEASRTRVNSIEREGLGFTPLPRDPQDPRFILSFSTNDEKQLSDSVRFFETYGFVVFSEVYSPEECAQTRSCMWDIIEQDSPGFDRNNRTTWGSYASAGKYGLSMRGPCFHPSLVRIRQHPNLVRALETIIGTEDVMVSHDRFTIYRATKDNAEFTTGDRNVHLDLNPWWWCESATDVTEGVSTIKYKDSQDFIKENNLVVKSMGCHVQCVLNFEENEAIDGGTILVPKFHKHIEQWCEADNSVVKKESNMLYEKLKKEKQQKNVLKKQQKEKRLVNKARGIGDDSNDNVQNRTEDSMITVKKTTIRAGTCPAKVQLLEPTVSTTTPIPAISTDTSLSTHLPSGPQLQVEFTDESKANTLTGQPETNDTLTSSITTTSAEISLPDANNHRERTHEDLISNNPLHNSHLADRGPKMKQRKGHQKHKQQQQQKTLNVFSDSSKWGSTVALRQPLPWVIMGEDSKLLPLAQRIPMRAGSVLMWDQTMVHGTQPNEGSTRCRMAMFLKAFDRTKSFVGSEGEARRLRRRAALRTCLAAGLRGTSSTIPAPSGTGVGSGTGKGGNSSCSSGSGILSGQGTACRDSDADDKDITVGVATASSGSTVEDTCADNDHTRPGGSCCSDDCTEMKKEEENWEELIGITSIGRRVFDL